MRCSQCGHEIPAGKAYCAGCGAATGTARPTPRPPRPAPGMDRSAARAPEPAAGPPRAPRGTSVWWIVIPTLFYAAVALDPVNTIVLVALGAVLKFAQGRPEVPAGAKPFLPLLQPVAVFMFFGGSPIPVAIAGAFGLLAVQQRHALVTALEPWWSLQRRLPSAVRFVIGLIVTLGVGAFFGNIADGREWTATFISVAFGTSVMFLFTFNPPPALRPPRGSGQGRREV